MDNLHGVNLLIAGGDRREVELYFLWRKAGYNVKMLGFELCDVLPPDAEATANDIRKAEVLIFPMSGINAAGEVKAIYAGRPLPAAAILAAAGGKLILIGAVSSSFREKVYAAGEVVRTNEDNELAVLNAVPTAEGAVQKAMELADITIHSSRSMVLGFGRCGSALARVLKGLGAEVAVLVRRDETRALAAIMNLYPFFEDQLPEELAKADIIFNTIPAMILHRNLLLNVKKNAVILDIASAPGGVDLEAARSLGLTAQLLPGLPGKAAPRTAAEILAHVYYKMIARRLGGRAQ